MVGHALFYVLAMGAATIAPAPLKPISDPYIPPVVRDDLTLEDIFPERSFFGKTARGVQWSHDDRYVAYLWNPDDERGFDIWMYDDRSGGAVRLTSVETFLPFDPTAKKTLERYQREKKREEERKGLSEEERKKLEEQDRREEQELRRRGEWAPDYAGISEFTWAHTKNEMLFVYKGDIYRLRIGEKEPERLTRTSDAERSPTYTKDDSGFYFQRDAGVYRLRFGSSMIEQLNPDLPEGMRMQSYRLSPDETKILLTSSRSDPPARQVDYLSYRGRFAEARQTGRSVAEDPFNTETFAWIGDVSDEPRTNPNADGKPPWQVYHWPKGKGYGQLSIHEEPWSTDSTRVTFAKWDRDRRLLEVVIADTKTKTVSTIFSAIHNGEHNTPGMARPFFTKDGQKVIALLEMTGFRHPWLIDPVTQLAHPITQGSFEVYPVQLSKDGRYLFCSSSAIRPARMNPYRVEIATGRMIRLGSMDGNYGDPTPSHSGKRIAITFSSWTSPIETYLADGENGGGEKALTKSHPDRFAKVQKLVPELFTYTNRHGHTIHGYKFLPPDFKPTDKRPLLIYVYGGPLGTGYSVVDGSFNSAAYMFNMYMTYRYGFVTVTIDPRGQSGYGSAFGAANWEQPGKAQVEDLQDGVKYLIQQGGIDETKVGVYGWSFGGFQTQMCMYTAPETFTLGIAGAGPTEWQNYNNWYVGGAIGDAQGKAETLDRFSLTKLVDKLKSPLLLVHGMEDTNVLFQDTIHVYQALLRAGKGPLVELVVDPTGGHGLGGDINRIQQYRIYEAFILKYWMPQELKRK